VNNHPINSQKARVRIKKYVPLTFSPWKPSINAIKAGMTPAMGNASQKGRLAFIINMATVYAPRPKKVGVAALT
jgi:hypothetical protein